MVHQLCWEQPFTKCIYNHKVRESPDWPSAWHVTESCVVSFHKFTIMLLSNFFPFYVFVIAFPNLKVD